MCLRKCRFIAGAITFSVSVLSHEDEYLKRITVTALQQLLKVSAVDYAIFLNQIHYICDKD